MTVEQNVAFALPEGLPRDVRASRVSDILEKVGLKAVAKVWPFQLSGGMEKRVALARALVNLPAILLMDEPFSALDPLNRFGLQDEVARIHAKEKLTTLLVTHDIDEAVYLSDRILVISGEPAAICAEFLVNNPRPRTRGSREMLSLQAEVFALMLAANTAPGVGSTTWTPTPKDNVKQQ
jgi:ABC-type nitrate/sulfonate/bicarbonate transport system ATPase subunit